MATRLLLSVFISIVLVFVFSCEEEKTHTLGIDVQSFFDEDEVQLFLDNKLILNETLTTNNILGLCKGLKITRAEGKHTLKVIINENFVKSEEINLHQDLYLGVRFDSIAKEISFIHSEHPFGYD